MDSNINKFYKINKTYENSNDFNYQIFKKQNETTEHYGAFSLRGTLRPPYGCGQQYCNQNRGCNTSNYYINSIGII